MARKKKIEVEQPKEIGLKVHHQECCFQSRDGDESGEQYCYRGETTTQHEITGLSIVDKYPDVSACFPVEDGDLVYLLYVVYSTGDSFGYDRDSSIAFVDVFKTKEKADAASTEIGQHHDWYNTFNRHGIRYPKAKKSDKKNVIVPKYKDSYVVDVIRENGETLQVVASWNGYFELLSYIEIASFVVGQGVRSRRMAHEF